MKLESDIDRIYGAIVLLEMIATQFQLIRSMPLERQIDEVKKLLKCGKNPHPKCRFMAKVADGALKFELVRLNQARKSEKDTVKHEYL
mgnify:CR=1 FL=1